MTSGPGRLSMSAAAPIVGALGMGYRSAMERAWKRLRLVALCGAVAVVAAGCAGAEPFVYKLDEFKREAPGFGKAPKDLETVTICYSAMSNTREEVLDLALDECARFAKTARFTGQNRRICPLLTPIAAEFACVAGPK